MLNDKEKNLKCYKRKITYIQGNYKKIKVYLSSETMETKVGMIHSN